MCIYMLVSLYTKLYMTTCVNVEDRGSTEGYGNAFREGQGDDEFAENQGDTFGENEGGYARGGDVEDSTRDQEKVHENAQ